MSSKAQTKTLFKLQLSPNFNASEFLVSKSFPKLRYYIPTISQIHNLKLLVKPLQKARNIFGPIGINGGGRPLNIVNKDGLNFYEALKARGFNPSKNSDHYNFAAADITNRNLPELFEYLKTLPETRQVIYYPNDNFIHYAVVYPGHDKIRGANYAFMSDARPKSQYA